MQEKRNVFRLHLIAEGTHVSPQISSVDSRMGLDSKESHRSTTITAYGTANPLVVDLTSWFMVEFPVAFTTANLCILLPIGCIVKIILQ